MKRILTALVLIPLVVWVILLAPVWAFIAAEVVVGLLALREAAQIGGNRAIPALGGLAYIGGAWLCAFALRGVNPHWLLFAFLLCWAGDTAALYVGKNFGRHKLAPVVSPGKTWEGAGGSLAGGVLAGALYAHYLIPAAPLTSVIVFAAIGNIAGQIGDLLESAYKRWGGVKDSGSSLPGHGGWLDRIDSSLLSIPVVYVLVHFFNWLLAMGSI